MRHRPHNEIGRRVSRRDAGFTLVEMVMALAVVAILAIVALPSLSDSESPYRVADEARSVHSRLVEARARASSEGRSYRVAFSAGTFHETQVLTGGVWTMVGPRDTLASGVSFTIGGGSDGTVTFEKHGRAAEARSIVVTNGQNDQEIQVLASGMAVWNANP